jgi:hypothetical protein
MRTLWQDLRYGLQMFGKNRGFTAVALVTLALGIGGNTAIFSVVNSVLLQPLDYKNPDRLVDLNAQSERRGIALGGVSVPEFLEWKKQARAFEGMAAYRFFAFTRKTQARCGWTDSRFRQNSSRCWARFR